MALPRPQRTLLTPFLVLATAWSVACGGDSPSDPGNGGGNTEPDPTGVVAGSVSEGGEGVAGVTLRLTGPGSTRSTTTDASGDFTFDDVRVGSWSLAIVVPETHELAGGSASRDVTVTDGGTARESFTLELFEGETVSIVDNAFQPEDVSVAAGTEVRWRATTATVHTVTPDGHDAFSEAQTTGQTVTILRATFDTPGNYPYYCVPHRGEGMTGQVTVN